MARYIDADLIFSKGFVEVSVKGVGDLINHISNIPTADVVEVVRCHNCEYHGIRDKCPLLNMSPYRDDERGYCSEGKRLE